MDLIEHDDRKKEKGHLVSQDIEESFDSLNQNFMITALESFNIGDKFCCSIKTLYDGAEAVVMNLGFSTKRFLLNRVQHQKAHLGKRVGVLQYFNIAADTFNIIYSIHLASTIWEVMMPAVKQGMKDGRLHHLLNDASFNNMINRKNEKKERLFHTLKTIKKGDGLSLADKTEKERDQMIITQFKGKTSPVIQATMDKHNG
uniref:Uncharacterized protein n=1 Tax=Romanomermis culicivorax TaxID=13658 RepID=A0A915JU47_ROMCU